MATSLYKWTSQQWGSPPYERWIDTSAKSISQFASGWNEWLDRPKIRQWLVAIFLLQGKKKSCQWTNLNNEQANLWVKLKNVLLKNATCKNGRETTIHHSGMIDENNERKPEEKFLRQIQLQWPGQFCNRLEPAYRRATNTLWSQFR